MEGWRNLELEDGEQVKTLRVIEEVAGETMGLEI